MENPPGTQQEMNHHALYSFAGTNPTNGNPVAESLGSSMMHNPGISLEWTPEEQMILEEGLTKYASETSIIRCAKIAIQLQNKTVRDVALRCRWMTKKESSKRRKEDNNVAKRSRDKKERVIDISSRAASFMTQTNMLPYAPSLIPMKHDDSTSCEAIGGITRELLEQNAQIFNQISANLSSLKIEDNINLFHQIRHNLLNILINLNETPEMMKQMPPLPVKLNEELANTILEFLHSFPSFC